MDLEKRYKLWKQLPEGPKIDSQEWFCRGHSISTCPSRGNKCEELCKKLFPEIVRKGNKMGCPCLILGDEVYNSIEYCLKRDGSI